ncbi:MAG: NAD(P)-dependent oxidoreductase [Nakamurella sp.]
MEANSKTIWAQWSDLSVPDGVELISTDPAELPQDVLDRIGFYVAPYLSGHGGLKPVGTMPNLAVLQVPNAGYDDAIEYLRPGITLCNARGVHDESTAELAVALALAGRRGFDRFAAAQNTGTWSSSPARSLTDSSIAVVGHGSIGKVIVRMLQGFSVTVTSFSRRGTEGARPVTELIGTTDRAGRIGEFDIVIVVVPLTAETHHLVNDAFLAHMRDGALLVNVARGAVVDTDALVAELQSGRLHAALDVTDPEPLPVGHPLWTAPNCIITPHVGGNTSAFEPRMRALLTSQVVAWTEGAELANVVARG